MQFEVCSVQCAVCIIQYAVCSVQYAVCSMQCVVCSVQFEVDRGHKDQMRASVAHTVLKSINPEDFRNSLVSSGG